MSVLLNLAKWKLAHVEVASRSWEGREADALGLCERTKHCQHLDPSLVTCDRLPMYKT